VQIENGKIEVGTSLIWCDVHVGAYKMLI